MAKTRCGAAAVVALGALLLSSVAVWAETPAEAAAQKRKTEKRIAKIEEKVAALQPVDLAGETRQKTAQQHLDLAKKLLAVGNDHAANVVTDLADRALTLGVKAEAQP